MIAVFGASVTQQKNGYATKLQKYFNHPIKVFGYGGMHLNNAAICFIDEVIAPKPSYCFIDWFSSEYISINDEAVQLIDILINKCSSINCKPIFLFVPSKDFPGRDDFHLFCKSILNKRKIFFIDVGAEIETHDINKVLRDTIHTTEYGSNLYGKVIYEKFMENRDNISVPNKLPDTIYMR